MVLGLLKVCFAVVSFCETLFSLGKQGILRLNGLEAFFTPLTVLNNAEYVDKNNQLNVRNYQVTVTCIDTKHPTIAPTANPSQKPTLSPSVNPTVFV